MHTSPTQSQGSVAYLPPQQPGWWRRNWKWAVPVGGTALVGVGIAACIGLFTMILGVMRQTEVYQTALGEAQSAPEVIERLGTPIEDGFLISGNIDVTPSSGFAYLDIPIEGPDGSGVLHVEAAKTGSEWTYYSLEVSTNDGAGAIDLMADW